MASSNAQSSNNQSKHMPKDAQVIISILKDMGVNDYEPQVLTQLLEFTYRYVTSTLEDARVYATHANKKGIDAEDVQLAVQMQLEKSFTSPPPRDLLLEVARAKNSTPLPLIKPHCGIRLPPDRYCMTACNYELKSNKKPIIVTNKASNIFPGGQSTVLKTQGKPNLKRTMQTISRTQAVTVPKPVIKFSPAPMSSDGQAWKQTLQVSAGPATVQTVMDVDEPPASLIKRETGGDHA